MPRGRATMRGAEGFAGLAHLFPSGAIAEKDKSVVHRRGSVGDLRGGTCLERELGRFRKIEHVRADDHRRPHCQRLDQVLAAKGRERAADHGYVAGAVVERHLAHRVAEEHTVGRLRPHIATATRLGPLRDLVEAARMPRNDNEEGIDVGVREQHLLFALAGAGEQHHVAAELAPPFASGRHFGVVGRDIELEVAGHLDVARAEGAQACGVGGALRADRANCAKGRPRQSFPATIARGRGSREARIGEQNRHRIHRAAGDQVRPDLGLHEDREPRPEVFEEPLHRPRKVVGQVSREH